MERGQCGMGQDGDVACHPGTFGGQGVGPVCGDTTLSRKGRVVMSLLGPVEGSWMAVPARISGCEMLFCIRDNP